MDVTKDKVEENIPKLLNLIKKEQNLIPFGVIKDKLIEELQKMYNGRIILGIFHKFNTIITTTEGDIQTNDLVKIWANYLAEAGFVVISDQYIYEKINNSICCESINPILNTIQQCSEKDYLSKMSEFLASLASYAVFILLNEDSMSQYEAIEFYKKSQKSNKLALAFHFVEELPLKKCKHLTKKESSLGFVYYICDSKDFNHLCKEEEANCFFTKIARLSASHMQLFINDPDSELIVLDNYKESEKLVLELIKKGKNFFT